MPGFRPPEIPTIEELIARNSYSKLADMAREAEEGFTFRMRALKVVGFLLGASYGAIILFDLEKVDARTFVVMGICAFCFSMLCWIAYTRQKEIRDNVVMARNRKRYSLPASTERV